MCTQAVHLVDSDVFLQTKATITDTTLWRQFPSADHQRERTLSASAPLDWYVTVSQDNGKRLGYELSENVTWRDTTPWVEKKAFTMYTGHREELLSVVILVVCIRACWIMHMPIFTQWRIGGDISCGTVTISLPSGAANGLRTEIVGSGGHDAKSLPQWFSQQ